MKKLTLHLSLSPFFRLFFAVVFILQPFSAKSFAASLVNFSVTLNTSKDPGDTYQNFRAAGATTSSAFTIAFQIRINSVDGLAVNLSPIAAFCSELAEPIGVATYTFSANMLSNISAGRAGQNGTASSFIPVGGIGALRAARVAYLFDQYYISDQLTGWTFTTTDPSTHAFQIALWELTHDTDLSINLSSGQVYVGAQTGNGNALRNNALSLAQTYLNSVAGANITASYTSTKFDFWALTDTNGAGATGWQDVILATNKNTPAGQLLSSTILLPIPEPGSFVCVLLGGAICLMRRRYRTII